MGRIYLPLEDLEKFDVPVLELRYGRKSKQFMELMRFEVQRARSFYHEAAPLVSMVERRSRGSLWALMRIYSRLLERIEASRYDVLARRIRVPAWEKCWILLRGFPR
jgi:phytoene synthase